MAKKEIKDLIDNYDASSVSKLEPLKHMFKKTSMYLGSVESPQHTIEEAIMNSMDEVQVGVANELTITYHEDLSISVKDNGRGIPPMYDKKFGMPTVRALLTVPNTGKGFTGNASGSSQNGVGMKATTATSDWLEVVVWRDGTEWFDRYELQKDNPGIPTVKLIKNELPKKKSRKGAPDHGTMIRWLPSDKVWDSIKFNWKEIKKLMHDLAYLNPGLTVNLVNEINNDNVTYLELGGAESMINDTIKKSESKLITPIYKFKKVYDTKETIIVNDVEEALLIKAEVTFAWTNDSGVKSILYTNNVPNPNGGTPVKGFQAGVARLINKYAKDLGLAKENIEQRDLTPGLIVIINMVHPDPKFDGQTKNEITSSNARNALNTLTFNEVQMQFDRTIDNIKKIIRDAIKRAELRKKEEDQKVNLKSKDVLNTINKKLTPSRIKGQEAELFIVEGDSAGGTLVDLRKKFQAILPVRGKVINTYKASASKIMANAELATLFGTIGTGIGKDFDIKKSNYGKIIIATDADPDGDAISCLLLTAILKFVPELVREGYVYRVLTPLYVNYLKDKSIVYSYTNAEQNQFMKSIKPSQLIKVDRNKGLGELSNQMVKDTILNTETRRLIRFNMNEDNEAEVWNTVERLMGPSVEPRRELFFNESLYDRDY